MKFTTVIEAKLLKVGPGLQNWKIAFIYRDLVLHGLSNFRAEKESFVLLLNGFIGHPQSLFPLLKRPNAQWSKALKIFCSFPRCHIWKTCSKALMLCKKVYNQLCRPAYIKVRRTRLTHLCTELYRFVSRGVSLELLAGKMSMLCHNVGWDAS